MTRPIEPKQLEHIISELTKLYVELSAMEVDALVAAGIQSSPWHQATSYMGVARSNVQKTITELRDLTSLIRGRI